MNPNDMNDTNGPDDMNANHDSNGFGCDAFAEELSLFVFGELEGERLAGLEKHLVGCAACRSERDALQRSLEILKSDGTRELEPQLSIERQAELMAQAQAQVRVQEVMQSSRRNLQWSRLAVAAGLVALAGASWYGWRKTESGPTVVTRLAATDARGEAPVADTSSLAAQRERGFNGPDDSVPTALSIDGDEKVRLENERRLLGETLERRPAPVDPAAAAPSEEAIAEVDFGTEGGSGGGKGEAAPLPAGDRGTASPDATALSTVGQPASERSLGLLPEPQERTKSAGGSAAHKGQAGESEAKKLSRAGPGGPQTPTPNPAPAARLAAPGTAAPNGAPAPEATMFPHVHVGPPSTTADAAYSYSARQQIGEFRYPVDEAEDSFLLDGYATDEKSRGEGGVNLLKSLGYLEDDTVAATPRAPLDPARVGRLLAATCAPSQVLLFQNRVAAALGIDPANPRDGLDKDRDTIVREFLDRLSRRQNEPPHDMFFRYFGDHPFLSTRIDCKSTFGMDVDTASYTLARAYLTKGMLPPKAAVRTEEFVNAFKHGLAPPNSEPRGKEKDSAGDDVFAIHTEVAPSPFGDEGQLLLQVGLKARVISKSARKPVALTFVIDVSGSMAQDGRLELVKQSLRLLVDQLDERDTIGIVSFETTGHRVLDPTNAANRARIFGALDQLRPEGSTNADQGLRLGYEMALEQLKQNAENRVILCSDGVANTGVTDPKWLGARIAECKAKYVYLNCVGVGMGNHNDALMEQLADEGDGFCAYVDKIEEAKKIFVERLTGTLMTVARNAKIQVEFDPASVRRFRQIGYENRALAHRDFRNDRVDAGEVGAGQEVVALYEIELKSIEPKGDAAGPLATVRVRYEDPDVGQVREQARAVSTADVAPSLQKASPRFRLCACVAEFAEILRQSVHARDGSLGAVARLAEPLVDELRGDADVPEFVALVQQAARLPDLIPPRNVMVRCVDELKKVRCRQEEVRDAKDAADEELMRQLEEQNRKLEQMLRDSLDRALRHS